MRWLFLLLLVLNGFYYVWHQQEAPLRAKDVTPLSLYRGSQQDIRLLSEAPDTTRAKEAVNPSGGDCLYIGGLVRQEAAQGVERRLSAMGVKYQSLAKDGTGAFWLRIAPESKRLLDESKLQNLSKEFNELKDKIMLCEGVAPTE